MILIISPESWGKLYVSKHHYALCLAERNQVYFLNPPGNLIKITETVKNLKVIDYKPMFKGIRFLPSALQAYLTKQQILRLEKRVQAKFDVVWNFDSSRFFNLKSLINKFRIAHIVDLNQNIMRGTLASTSDLCLGVTNGICEQLKKFNPNTHLINHGYHISRSKTLNKVKLPGRNNIKALLLGNLSRFSIDWKILNQVVKNSPNVDFVFIGPAGKSNLGPNEMSSQNYLSKTEGNNVHFTGAVNSEEIHQWLEQADILLISFKEDFHEQQTNSHKLMQYFGAGKVVVATYTADFKDRPELILMSENNSAFPELFNQVLNKIDYHNSKEYITARKNFALDNTYQKQIERIAKLIDTL
ncbi:MAG: glycosyltransferase [Cyclobacteriaceae bacterium]